MSGKDDDAVKNLDYYIEHPDEMPTDPEAIAKIMKESEAAEGEDQPVPTEDKKTDPKPSEAAPASAAEHAEEKVDGILTKDGKHFLPYEEMQRRIDAARKQGEDQSRSAAEATAGEVVDKLKGQLNERETKIAQLEQGKQGEAVDPIEGIPAELLQTFREEYPTQAKIIDPLIAAIKHRDGRIGELEASLGDERKAREKTDAEIAADEVQVLINGNQDLASWQQERPMLFDLSIRQEERLMGDQKWRKEHPELVNDDAKRYEHVVTLVKQAVGLPAASPKNDNADLDRKAEDVVAGAQPLTPHTLSDIKGGKPPAQSLEDNLEGVSPEQLASHLLGMTEEQRDRWFARLG